MATQLQLRRGNTAQTAVFTGAIAEVTVDTDKKTIVVHDGTTPGGFALALASSVTGDTARVFDHANSAFDHANLAFNKANSAGNDAVGAFTNANTGFVCGGIKNSSGLILKTYNGGNTWQQIFSSTLSINDITFISDSIGFACGDSLLILKTTDGGQTWNQLQIPFVPVSA